MGGTKSDQDHEQRTPEERAIGDLAAMTWLSKVSALFLGEGGLRDVLGQIVEAAIHLSAADFGNIQLLDPSTGELRIVAHRNLPDWWIEYWQSVSLGVGSCGTALLMTERVIVEDVVASPIFVGTPALQVQLGAEIRAVQSTPLLTRAGRVLGILSTHWKHPGRPDDRTLGFLDLLARQAADIVERVHAEEALRAANERLMVADRRKNEFLAVLSHELRSPLAPIRNSLHVLTRAAPGSAEADRAERIIVRQVDQLARLVDDLLDLTRMTQSKIQLRRMRLDLEDIALRTVEDHRSLFTAAGVHLQVELCPTELYVDVDSARVAQILGNLLNNSAKFTPRGGRVVVSLSADAERRQALLRVADTGVGIAPEMMERLFEPFAQADATLDRSKGGLGLGLALIKGLVELHGGSIHATSAGLGQGTEVTVALPLVASEGRTREPEAPPISTVRRRVLVIEDNQDAAESLRDLLELENQDVAVAFNGPDGIAKAREFRPEIVLCDVGLPGMSGYEVAQAFRADESLRHAVLVAITGYSLPEDVERATVAGFEHHLSKPPSLKRLTMLLGRGTTGPPAGSG